MLTITDGNNTNKQIFFHSFHICHSAINISHEPFIGHYFVLFREAIFCFSPSICNDSQPQQRRIMDQIFTLCIVLLFVFSALSYPELFNSCKRIPEIINKCELKVQMVIFQYSIIMIHDEELIMKHTEEDICRKIFSISL